MKFKIFILSLVALLPSVASAEVYADITFPVDGPVSFSDTFGADRSGGRTHEGTDILAEKHTPVVAAVSGTIGYSPLEEPSYGWIINLNGDDGYEYVYIHLNNDNYGTDDGLGGRELAIADGIVRGARVEQGQLLGWVGDSGNAEHTAPHLHFEIRENDVALNSYDTLVAAHQANAYDPELERSLATSISTDLDITPASSPVCEPESLIRSESQSTVYYCGVDGNRYTFQNERVFFTWFDDFEDVTTVSDEFMGTVPLKGVVTYRPGNRLVKIQSVDKVYAVARNGTLRWVPSEAIATDIYGNDWATQVDDIPDGFFPRYQIGEPITTTMQ